ncbi:hypothetical protein NHI66_000932 [Clostridium botulinum]|nr:hypothetical protein [Clostridium botulinum]
MCIILKFKWRKNNSKKVSFELNKEVNLMLKETLILLTEDIIEECLSECLSE